MQQMRWTTKHLKINLDLKHDLECGLCDRRLRSQSLLMSKLQTQCKIRHMQNTIAGVAEQLENIR